MRDIVADSMRARDCVAVHSYVKRSSSPFSIGSLRVSLLATTAICAVMALPHPASAQSPTGGSVVAGTAGISQAGAVTNINQSSQKAIINWQGFSVGAQNTVNFNQPNSSAATLNRVIGNERSVIDGAVNANGQVFIVNSNGVLFGKGAQVNVGGLVASTLDISNSDFMAGNYKFSGTSNASVVNQGRIRARGDGQGGGYVALLGKTVSNEGVIAAKLGTVAMAAGEQITLNFGGDSLLDVTIDKGTLNALIANKRAIIANGGQVIMTARAADQVLSAQVNNSGIIQARTMAALKGGSNGTVKIGRIKLLAQGGTTSVSGKLDASAPKGGDGGFIETSGDKVNIADSAVITTLAPDGATGMWLIDPVDFTIAAAGGDISGATLSSLLNMTSQGFSATNNLYVNDAVSWSANTTLTLTAGNNLYVNKAITATGASAGLVFTAGNDINVNNAVRLDGATATLAMTYGGDYNIRTPASYAGTTTGPIYDKDGNPVYEPVAVQKVNPPLAYPRGTKASYGAPAPGPAYDADGNPIYELVQGGQATGPVAKQDTSGGVYGSITFSNGANTFSMNPNGLVINGQPYRLIHSMTELAAINNIANKYALATNLDAGATTYNYVVVGTLGDGSVFTGLGHTIDGLTIRGSAAAVGQTSGLFGKVTGSTLRDLGVTNVDINVSAPAVFYSALVGALAGSVGISGATPSTVYNVYSSGEITASQFTRLGGLIGYDLGNSTTHVVNTVTNAFSTVNVTTALTQGTVGGLIGTAANVILTNTHATGNVQGQAAGGLAGGAAGDAFNSYATGTVTTRLGAGGLFGDWGPYAFQTGTLSNSFATGDVFGGSTSGGLIGTLTAGDFDAVISNVYATGDVHAMTPGALGLVDPGPGVGGLIGVVVAINAGNVIVTNAHASGDVIASLNYGPGPDLTAAFGGLVGQFYDTSGGSLIKNSYATGKVDASQAATVQPVGGLGGRFSGVDIKGSYSTGAVIGKDVVGGLVGMFLGSSGPRGALIATIDNSWTTSTVTATNPDPLQVGALIGQAHIAAIGPNVFYNGETAGGVGLGGAAFFGGVTGEVNNSQGLTGSQLADARFYANGTISQVLASRAVAAQAAQAATEAAAARQADIAQGEQGARSASVTASNTQNSSETPPNSGTANAGTPAAKTAKSAAVEESVKSVDDAVKADDTRARQERERQERQRRAAAQQRGDGRAGSGGNFGATIRSIDVDGQRFNLQDGAPKQDAPVQAPQ